MFAEAFAASKPRYPFLLRVFVLLSGSVASAALTFITQLVLTRTLSIPDCGRLVALLAVVNILQVLAGYGIGWLWLQLFGREGWAAFRWVAPSVQLLGIASAIGATLLAGYVFLTSNGSVLYSSLIAALIVPILLGQSLLDVTSARLQLEERYVALAIWQSATQLGRFLLVVLIIAWGFSDLPHVLAAYGAVGLLSLAISAASLYQVQRQRIRLIGHVKNPHFPSSGDRATLPALFAAATPYCFCTIFYLVYSQSFVAIVERMLGPEAAAEYNVAFLIVSAIYIIPSVVYMKYLVSKMFRWWAQDRRMFSAVFHIGVATTAVFGIFSMLAVMAAARFLIPLLFGSRYSAAVPILMLLSLAIPIRFVQHAFGSAFFSQENMKRKAWYMGWAALSCILFSLVLIPLLSTEGAALSTVLAEVTLLALYVHGVARHVDDVDVRSTFRVSNMRAAATYIENSRASRP